MAGFFDRLLGRGKSVRTALDRDTSLARIVDSVLEGCEYALAAGDGAADMAVQLAKRHPHREILACEPKSELCYQARNRAGNAKNIYLHNVAPRQFLNLAETDKPYLLDKDVLVVLTVAGGGAERRFFDEVSFVATTFAAPWLLVLGSRVPDRDEFSYDSHRGRECSLKNLAPHLAKTQHTLYLPDYPVASSKRRAVSGWCLAALGRNAVTPLPEEIAGLAIKSG
ncbi:hypothetical protein [Desulfovibrio ferrophilus]|uniref:tRNA1(Val) (Adenine(37)-N6)-methyltransferase n=1 Tax=Desulfovibrio ferrophilus TaxID=241368 RepID=A0A2Z6AU58_9BACT|nr:hypothetical protein [Desulfovibrio ferrophilus]BBD06761.1 tRNA1(Val) (adenine(37)-N6)-methyltransferase [Desulfovibrio ferrophilus]